VFKRKLVPMDETFKQISISDLRSRLAKLKRKVQLGQLRLVITCHREIVAFLVPLSDVNPEKGFPLVQVEEMPLTKFRDQIHESWQRLQAGVGCIYLTFHTRPVVAFVAAQLVTNLPVSKDAYQVSSLIDGFKIYTPGANTANA